MADAAETTTDTLKTNTGAAADPNAETAADTTAADTTAANEGEKVDKGAGASENPVFAALKATLEIERDGKKPVDKETLKAGLDQFVKEFGNGSPAGDPAPAAAGDPAAADSTAAPAADSTAAPAADSTAAPAAAPAAAVQDKKLDGGRRRSRRKHAKKSKKTKKASKRHRTRRASPKSSHRRSRNQKQH